MEREKLYTTTEAAKYIGVTSATLRNWHKEGKLVPTKTPGGHRRYTEEQLCKIINENKNGYNYINLYSYICKCVDILEHYHDENAIKLKKIRENIGSKLLSQFKGNLK